MAKKRGINNAFCINLKDFNPKEKYDIALAIEIFLVTKPSEFLNEIKPLLKDEGIIIFTATNKNSWRYKLHSLRKNKSRNYDVYNLSEYQSLIRNKGFEILRIEGFNWMPFKVNSNSIFVNLFALIEKIFFLKKWIRQSPWYLFACKRI